MSEWEHTQIGLGYVILKSDRPLDPFWTAPVVEPQKRNKDGWRYISHRFPIKGGITEYERTRREDGERLVSLLNQPVFLEFSHQESKEAGDE